MNLHCVKGGAVHGHRHLGLLSGLRLAQWHLWAIEPPGFHDGKQGRKGYVASRGGFLRLAYFAGQADVLLGRYNCVL